MPARFVIAGAVFVALVLGAVASVLLLDAGPAPRMNAAVTSDIAGSSADEVRPGLLPAPTQPIVREEQPATTSPKPAEQSEKSARAKLFGELESGLREMAELQSGAYEATSQLGSELEDLDFEWNDELRGQLKTTASSQADVQRLAARILGKLRSGNLADMVDQMEQVQRLLAAIMGALGAKVPDVGYTTQAMQDGVFQTLQKMLEVLQAERDSLLEEQPVAPASAQDSLTVSGDHIAQIKGDRSLTNLTVEPGAKFKVGTGTLTVTGDFRNEGVLESSQATLDMSGGNQSFSGEAAFQKVRFSGGTKRISAGSTLTTTYNKNSTKNNPALVVEAGTTLIIDKDATVYIPNPYGLRVAGTLIIDGGTLHCSFTHGDGKDPGTSSYANNGMNKTWIPGCQLIIRSGSFIGDGDASFAGASVYVQGGELRIHDDIWGSGDLLEISGGVMSNDSSGGMFALTGQVRLTGGRLEVNQYEGRGLYVTKEAEVWSTSGEVVIGGQDASNPQSGMVLAHDVQLPNLQLTVSTLISNKSPEGTTLSVSGSIAINKGKKLLAQGRRVLGNVETGEDRGILEP